MRYFTIAEQDTHHAGDLECPGCAEQYPERCVCGGVIHAEPAGPEDEGGEVWLVTRCDECGRSEDEIGEELGREPT
jgi:hypothetical protein